MNTTSTKSNLATLIPENFQAKANTVESSASLSAVQSGTTSVLASRRSILSAGLGTIGSVALPAGLGAWLAMRPEQVQANPPWVVSGACSVPNAVDAPAAATVVWKSNEEARLVKICRYTTQVSYKAVYRSDNTTIQIGEVSYYKNPINKKDQKQTKPVFEKYFEIKKNPASGTITIHGPDNAIIENITVDSINNPTTFQHPNSITSADNVPNDDKGDILRRRTRVDPRRPVEVNENEINQQMIDRLTDIFIRRIRQTLDDLLDDSTQRMQNWLNAIAADNFDRNTLTRRLTSIRPFSNTATFGMRLLVRIPSMPANHYISMTLIRLIRPAVTAQQYVVSLSHIETTNAENQNPVYHDEFHPSYERGEENYVDTIFWRYREAIDLLLTTADTYHNQLFAIVRIVSNLMMVPRMQARLNAHPNFNRAIVGVLTGVLRQLTSDPRSFAFEIATSLNRYINSLQGGTYLSSAALLISAVYDTRNVANYGPQTLTYILNLSDDDAEHRQLLGYTHDRRDLIKKPIINPGGSCRGCSGNDKNPPPGIGGPDAVGTSAKRRR